MITDRPWPVVTRERMLAALEPYATITRTWANVVLYGDRDGRLLAYAFNNSRFHLRPDLV